MSRSEAGQPGFSVLLFQDLAVIPALALVPCWPVQRMSM